MTSSEQSKLTQLMSQRGPWLVAVLTLAIGGFTLTLDFAQDDYWVLPTAADQLQGVLAMPWDGAPVPPKPDSPTFQPTLWLWVAAMDAMLPRPWPAWPFHAVVLLLHAMAVALLCRVLTRRCGPTAAVAACVLFALTPMGMQAWTWISASGAVLGLLFTLWAVDVFDRNARSLGTISLLTALAVLSQRGAVVALPFILLLVWNNTPAPKRWTSSARVVALPLAGLLLQSIVIGFAYTGGTRAGFDSLPSCFAALPTLFMDMLAFRCDAPLATAAWSDAFPRALLLLPWIALFCAGLMGGTRHLLRGMFLVALASVPAALHWGMLAASGLTTTGSRTLYLPTAALCALVAIVLGNSGRWKPVAVAGVLLATALSADAFLARSADERAAAQSVRDLRAQVCAIAAQLPRDALILVAEPEPTRAGLPLVSAPFVADALRPPFIAAHLRVRAHHSTATLLSDPDLRAEPTSLGVLDRTTGRSAVLPALPQNMPSWTRAASGFWVPSHSLPARALNAVQLRPAPGSAVTGAQVQAGAVTAFAFARDVGSEERIIIGFADDFDLLCAPSVDWIATQGTLDLPPATFVALPELVAALKPEIDAVIPAGTMPEFVLPAWPRAAGANLEFRFQSGDFQFEVRYGFTAEQAAPDGNGITRLQPIRMLRENSTKTDFTFEDAVRLFHEQLRPFGIQSVGFEWRVTATASGSPSPMARTAWRRARLVAP
ncbi:MAG: hypothetical protein EXS14_08950 [Planctomycetes bacterium]|nr:hypothetical protein [Planctomycetota bacterium]